MPGESCITARSSWPCPDEIEISEADFERGRRAWLAEHPAECEQIEQAWQRVQAQRVEKVKQRVHPSKPPEVQS